MYIIEMCIFCYQLIWKRGEIYLNKDIKEKIIYEEDTTNYGEFITSYFAWVPLDKQKEIVERLENIDRK